MPKASASVLALELALVFALELALVFASALILVLALALASALELVLALEVAWAWALEAALMLILVLVFASVSVSLLASVLALELASVLVSAQLGHWHGQMCQNSASMTWSPVHAALPVLGTPVPTVAPRGSRLPPQPVTHRARLQRRQQGRDRAAVRAPSWQWSTRRGGFRDLPPPRPRQHRLSSAGSRQPLQPVCGSGWRHLPPQAWQRAGERGYGRKRTSRSRLCPAGHGARRRGRADALLPGTGLREPGAGAPREKPPCELGGN